MESMDIELRLKAWTTARLFFMSLLLLLASLGEPCGVAIGVAAVWVIIGGFKGPPGGPPWLSKDVFRFSSRVTETDGGKPSMIFSAKRRKQLRAWAWVGHKHSTYDMLLVAFRMPQRRSHKIFQRNSFCTRHKEDVTIYTCCRWSQVNNYCSFTDTLYILPVSLQYNICFTLYVTHVCLVHYIIFYVLYASLV